MNGRRADYGVDAPYVPAIFAAITIVGIVAGVVVGTLTSFGNVSTTMVIVGVVCGVITGSYLYTTRAGKFTCWDRILDQLQLESDEHILDLGCGRGAVLTAAAKRVPTGRVVGVDVWKSADQSGNAINVTQRNADREGVDDRVRLDTGDITTLSYPDSCFDVVVSSLAIHNITDPAGQGQAVNEAVRVLRPGGRIALADIRATRHYAAALVEAGMTDVSHRRLGWRFWFGGPQTATSLVTGNKPTNPATR